MTTKNSLTILIRRPPYSQIHAAEALRHLGGALGESIHTTVLLVDEVTYAAESDPAFLSSLQHAWDQHFKSSKIIIILSGSHVHTMETLLAQGSPLFGRFTGQLHLEPLDFRNLLLLRHFDDSRRPSKS